jgi:hypothetical protein
VNRPNGAFVTAPKKSPSTGVHPAPCTIPDTNSFNKADVATNDREHQHLMEQPIFAEAA